MSFASRTVVISHRANITLADITASGFSVLRWHDCVPDNRKRAENKA